MFADDTKIWCVVKQVEDNLLLQKDLDSNSMAEWSEEWLLRFTRTKRCQFYEWSEETLKDWT